MPHNVFSRTVDMFNSDAGRSLLQIGRQAVVAQGFALPWLDSILDALERVQKAAPFRHMVTPGGRAMSVALTNCGQMGWVTDPRGYRYSDRDPISGLAWPPMPDVFLELAAAAASEAGFANFRPDACLINRYEPGARLSLHQDKDEQSYEHPIVSLSLGIPATFLFGGHRRDDKIQRIQLNHGDVVVWGGEDRLRYHGVSPVKDDLHALLGAVRINLTLRKAS